MHPVDRKMLIRQQRFDLRAAALLRAFFRPHLAMTTLALRQSFAAIRWMEDLHLQAVVRTRHTKKAPGESGLRGTFDERSRAQGALVLLSQKVAADGKENHLFGKIYTSAMGGWNGSELGLLRLGACPSLSRSR